jgi:hypothetical protein
MWSQILYHLPHPLRIRIQIPRRRADVGVPQDRRQRGDVAMILREEARREAVAQRVRRHRELDPARRAASDTIRCTSRGSRVR